MKRVIYILCILGAVSAMLSASENEADSVPVFLKTWRISDAFATPDSIPVDTIHLNFQNDNQIDRFSISNAYRANLGSPIQSKIFFDRPATDEFIFSDAYYPYTKLIESATFYNTKTPYSSLYYLSGGTNYYEDEQIRFLFTANANKKLNFGTSLDYIYARGEYANISAKRFAGSFWGTYDGRRYKATGFAAINNHSNFENGGIQDTSFINGTIVYPTPNIPVNLETAFSNYKHNQLFFNHQYNFGIERMVNVTPDSVAAEYVPVTIFGHTLKVDDMRKRYYEEVADTTFYDNTYWSNDLTNDTASYLLVTNRLSVSLAEEFNKWMKFGLTVYLENEIKRFGYLTDENVMTHTSESNSKLGAVLSKHRGRIFKYNAHGELIFFGPNAGDFLLDGNIGGYFNLWNQKISLVARGFMRSALPVHLQQNYYSNHFRWENDFGRVYTTHIGGNFAIPTLNFDLDVAVENISNLVYYNQSALPEQYSGNIQIVAANLKQDFHVGRFTLENNVVYQLSSRQDIVPLPEITLYHNLYYDDLWFKVLSMQIGVDMRYHTSYYAPSYMPATGQFFVQNKMEIGNYPVMSAYINAHLKRTRFFVQYYHINQLFMQGDYYSMPYYPINPAILKMGLSWNFYN